MKNGWNHQVPGSKQQDLQHLDGTDRYYSLEVQVDHQINDINGLSKKKHCFSIVNLSSTISRGYLLNGLGFTGYWVGSTPLFFIES